MKRLVLAAIIAAAFAGPVPAAQATIVICDNMPVFANCFHCHPGAGCTHCTLWVRPYCV